MGYGQREGRGNGGIDGISSARKHRRTGITRGSGRAHDKTIPRRNAEVVRGVGRHE